MCRYAMVAYKPHYACFDCRKTFKRRLMNDIHRGSDKNLPARCPECSGLMADMGLDFEAPKKKDLKAWAHIATLYKVEITFHSCGCSGPGYIPADSKALVAHFEKIKTIYLKHQHFWARRKEDPTTESEVAKDQHKNKEFLWYVPKKMKTGTKQKPKYDADKAQKYWNDNVLEIERKIESITNCA